MTFPSRAFTVTFTLLISLSLVQNSTQDKSWSEKHVQEPECKKCACVGTPLTEKHKVNILRILDQQVFEPLMGKCGVIALSTMLRGRGIQSNSDADQMCLTHTFDRNSGIMSAAMDGVNQTARFSLRRFVEISIYNIKQLFDPQGMSEAHAITYNHMTAPKRQNIVWTDGTSMLVTLCRFNGESCWIVKSSKKTLDRQTKKIILKKVAALGFDRTKAYSLDYSACN